jgi:hypothetical protein
MTPLTRALTVALVTATAACTREQQATSQEEALRASVNRLATHWVDIECGSEPIIGTNGEPYDVPGTGCYYQRREVDHLEDMSWRVRFSDFGGGYCLYLSEQQAHQPVAAVDWNSVRIDWDC